MASTSCNDLAQQLLACCLNGERWPDGLLDQLATPDCSDALFHVVVERLADLFEPRLCDVYAEMFSSVLERATGELEAAELVSRYREVRAPRLVAMEPKTVFVLSRVTLGADVAITSVLLDAAKKRFPDARVVLVGGRKSWELFAGDSGIEHAALTYLRSGSVRERLALWPELKQLLGGRDSIVIDPDSRLTQLGLLPVCPNERYRFFESRAYGGDGDDALPVLAALWARQTLGVEGAAPWIAPAQSAEVPGHPLVTMSFGVGENQAKRMADPFEEKLVQRAAQSGAYVLIDQGAGGEEAERVERAIARSGAPPERIRSFRGPFAMFASAIAQSDLYIGYDSAGQHVAAARGVPLISIFAGFPSPRFLSRWRPWGKGRIEVIPVSNGDSALERCLETLGRFVMW